MSEKATLIAEVKKRIAAAEIELAIEQLLIFLEKDPAYLNLHSDALQALAQLRKVTREEAQGIISFDQARLSYNQVINLVLNILEELQREAKPAPGGAALRKRPVALIAGLLLTIAAAIAVFFFLQNKGPQGQLTDYDLPCPGYGNEADFKVLLLPYRLFPQTEKIADEDTPILLRNRFEQFSEQEGIRLQAAILIPGQEVQKDPQRFPPSGVLAGKLGGECGAQLVVWGFNEKQSGGQIYTTKYRFLNLPNGGVALTKLMLRGDEVDTVQVISPIATTNTLTEEIENTIRLLFTIIAHQSGNDEAMIGTLEELQPQGDSARLIRDMMLGEAYLRTGQEEKAGTFFDTLVDNHPNYWLGWYNRGIINLQKGNFEAAASDLTQRLALDSTDAQARLARGTAFLRLDLLARADRDLTAAKKAMPDNETVNQRLDTVRKAIARERVIRDRAVEKLRQNPADDGALRDKVQADLRLGNVKAALIDSRKWLQQDPNSQEAVKMVIQAHLENNQPEQALKVLKNARDRRILRPNVVKQLQTNIQQRE